jgi:DNA-binding XRE family transcriptional regulator
MMNSDVQPVDLEGAALSEVRPWPLLAGKAGGMKVDVKQVKAARELLGWSQDQLSAASDVSISTIKLLESREGPLGGLPETRAKILIAMEKAGIEFPGNGMGVHLVPPTKRTRHKKS